MAMPLASVTVEDSENLSRAQFVFEALRQAIQRGDYRGGRRIREEDVAKSLGVSRTPVREALLRLQSSGLVEFVAGGLVVSNLTTSQISELSAYRELLEGAAAGLAAMNATPAEILQLKHFADIFAKSEGNPKKLQQSNRQLHRAICMASHNRYLLKSMDSLIDILALLPRKAFTIFLTEDNTERSIKAHERIIDAIEKRDVRKAEEEARLHIRNVQDALLKILPDDLTPA